MSGEACCVSMSQLSMMEARKRTTVEPLYNGHHWEPTFCPLYQGVHNSGASSIFPVGVVCKSGEQET